MLTRVDGGGVRGLSSLYLLKAVFDRLKEKGDKREPCEVFDMIGGTSTGGYVFCMASIHELY
jgi:patatin-like phospholipase/acyl hydrolase